MKKLLTLAIVCIICFSNASFAHSLTTHMAYNLTEKQSSGINNRTKPGNENDAEQKLLLCSDQTHIPVDECIALRSFYYAADGTSWTTNTSRLDYENPCNRYGVTCANGHVTRLNMQNNNITGPLPYILSSLSELEELSLIGNNLGGEIPGRLGDLSSLEILQLADNDLIGDIPVKLGLLENLEILTLGMNNLTGPIPTEIGHLNVEVFSAVDNQLCGYIPESFVQLPAVLIDLASNNLFIEGYSDSMMEWITNSIDAGLNITPMNEAQSCDFTFSCSIQEQLPLKECEALVDFYTQTDGENWNINYLRMNTNTPCERYGITCSDHPEYPTLQTVKSIILTHNNLYGSLPTTITQLDNMEILELPVNELGGMLLQNIGEFASLITLKLQSNNFSGPIPESLGDLSQAKRISLVGNELTGPIPTSIGNLESIEALVLGKNKLSGSLPSSIGQLDTLKRFYVYHNDLSGELPESIGYLPNLEALYVNGNEFCGYIPESFLELDFGFPEAGYFVDNNFETSGYSPEMTERLQTIVLTPQSGESCIESTDPVCGNGMLEAGEECDDGNNTNDDLCTNTCESNNPFESSCGNGLLELGEDCDDGNQLYGDGCSARCYLEW